MAREKPVLVGIDGSDYSTGSLKWAAEEANRRGLDLTVLHCISPYVSMSEGTTFVLPATEAEAAQGEAILASAVKVARGVAPDLLITTLPVWGGPAKALLAAADNASMIVVGSRGRGGFSELFLGSASLQVATHAHVPVVVVPQRRDDRPGTCTGRIVVGVDTSDGAQEALSFAFEEAHLRGVGLTAIRAWHAEFYDSPGAKGGLIPPHVTEDLFGPAEIADLGESVLGWREKYPDVQVQERVVHGHAAHVLIENARGAEMLVVSSRGRGGFRSLLLGSVSHAVLHHASSPIAVIHRNAS